MTHHSFQVREEARAEIRAAAAACRSLAPETFDRALEETGRIARRPASPRSLSSTIVAAFERARSFLGGHA